MDTVQDTVGICRFRIPKSRNVSCPGENLRPFPATYINDKVLCLLLSGGTDADTERSHRANGISCFCPFGMRNRCNSPVKDLAFFVDCRLNQVRDKSGAHRHDCHIILIKCRRVMKTFQFQIQIGLTDAIFLLPQNHLIDGFQKSCPPKALVARCETVGIISSYSSSVMSLEGYSIPAISKSFLL